MLPFPFPDPSLSSCDALLKMPLAVDHQGDQEASVGAALHRVYTPPIHRIYNDASAAVLLNVPFSSAVDSNPFSGVVELQSGCSVHQSGWCCAPVWTRVCTKVAVVHLCAPE